MARLQGITLNRNSSRLLLLVALVAGLIAAVLVFLALQDNGGSDTTVVPVSGDTVKVVVASRDISPGTEVTAGMLKEIDVPADVRVKSAFTDSTLVVGEVTNVAITEGEQVTPGKIGPIIDDEGIGAVVAKGMRGLSVEIQEATAVGGLLLPGDRVDVIATFEGQDDAPTVAVTVLQDIEILAVSQTAQEAVGISEGEAQTDLATSGRVPNDVDTEPDARTATLSVTPEQALLLAAVQDDPDVLRVWLAVRPNGEELSDAPDKFEITSLFE